MDLEERIACKICKSYTSCFSLFANNGNTSAVAMRLVNYGSWWKISLQENNLKKFIRMANDMHEEQAVIIKLYTNFGMNLISLFLTVFNSCISYFI